LARRKDSSADESWWTVWPGLLDDEFGAFSKREIAPRTLYKANGILILEADWPVPGQADPMRLQIGFSPLHPFFRPAVAAPDDKFERHQNPLTRELCLLTQERGQWNSRQLVADFVQERLEQVLSVLGARKERRWDDAAKLEEQAPDPLMPYFAGAVEDDSVILFDGGMPLPPGGHGLMEVVYTHRNNSRNATAFEGVLRRLKNSSGGTVGNIFTLPNDPTDAQVVTGRWVKFRPPPVADAVELLALAEKQLAAEAVLQGPSVQRVNQAAAGPFSITGIVFPDETDYSQQRNGAGWLFLVTRQGFVAGNTQRDPETRLVRGERAGKDDIFSRLPVARSLLKKKVLLVGCGAIGAFAGLELARAGVGELTFVDFDTTQPGNSLRWPLGRSAWGSAKASALANFVATNYPWTKAAWCGARVGEAVSNPARIPPDLKGNLIAQLLESLREAHLVVDTSASFEVQDALAYYCRKFNVAYVMGYATLGVAGGVVGRFLPSSRSCLVCLREHGRDGTIPAPREDASGVVTPVGCNAPTFTGGGFDLQEVSLEIVRTAVGSLADGEYDAGAWSVAVLTLKDEHGARVLPHWEAYECAPHPRCCGAPR
jgi:hypothetical protein